MPIPGCQLSVWVDAPSGIIRVAGRAAAEGAQDFKLLVQKLLDQGVSKICLDLSSCLLMDSTFSGVLAGLAGSPESPASPRRQFVLAGANARVLDLLDNLGVLPLVTVLTATDVAVGGDPAAATQVSVGGHSKDEMARCCLDAHRLLMGLKPENAAKFKTVTEVLEQQLQTAG